METVTAKTKRSAEMKRSTELFTGFRSLFRLYDKLLKKVCMEHDLTVIEADIISFLQNNPGKDTAADIVELRMLSKGAVSKGVDSLIRKIPSGADPGYRGQEEDPSEAYAPGRTRNGHSR